MPTLFFCCQLGQQFLLPPLRLRIENTEQVNLSRHTDRGLHDWATSSSSSKLLKRVSETLCTAGVLYIRFMIVPLPLPPKKTTPQLINQMITSRGGGGTDGSVKLLSKPSSLLSSMILISNQSRSSCVLKINLMARIKYYTILSTFTCRTFYLGFDYMISLSISSTQKNEGVPKIWQ